MQVIESAATLMILAFRIFISCVSTEFRTYRTSLRTALTSSGREIKIQEDFHDGAGTLMEKLDHYITRCQAVIHLVGSSTGEKAKAAEIRWLLQTYPNFAAVLPELADQLDPESCPFSYTQWECFLALYHRVPCFIYRAGDSSEREPEWRADAAAMAAQTQHVERLRALGQDRRMTDFADARDVALRFLNSYLADAGQAPANAVAAVEWPTISAADYRLADRETEFAELCALLRGDASHRLLGVHGPSDRGKSALLAEFFQFVRKQQGIRAAYAEFKTSLPLSDVLLDLRRDLNAIRFPRFDRQRDNGTPEMRRQAFLLDVEESGQPVVLILDAFEQATEEASQWVLTRLLPLCDPCAGIRVVLGGQTLPDLHANHRLARRVRCFELPPIREAAPWCDYGRRVLGLSVEKLPDAHIGTLVTAAKGSPRVVSGLLNNLKSSGAHV
jgi:hypothetical protein